MGSAKMIETVTPLPDAIGFSDSGCTIRLPLFADVIGTVFTLPLLAPPCVGLSAAGLDIAQSSKTMLGAALLERIVLGLTDAVEREVLLRLSASGLVDLVELAAVDVAVEDDEENEEKTVPRTRLAFSRDASFPSSRRNVEDVWWSGGGGRGLRSRGRNLSGSRVMCMEYGRRCRGRQGGDGSLGVRDFSARTLQGV